MEDVIDEERDRDWKSIVVLVVTGKGTKVCGGSMELG